MRSHFLWGCLLCPMLLSAAAAQNSLVRFPQNSTSWLNSSPITARTLKGKAAVLYYFEES